MNPKQLATLAARLPEPERSEFVSLITASTQHYAQAAELKRQAQVENSVGFEIATRGWVVYHSVVPPRAIPSLLKPIRLRGNKEPPVAEMLEWLRVQAQQSDTFSRKWVEEHREHIGPGFNREVIRAAFNAATQRGLLMCVDSKQNQRSLWKLA